MAFLFTVVAVLTSCRSLSLTATEEAGSTKSWVSFLVTMPNSIPATERSFFFLRTDVFVNQFVQRQKIPCNYSKKQLFSMFLVIQTRVCCAPCPLSPRPRHKDPHKHSQSGPRIFATTLNCHSTFNGKLFWCLYVANP